MLCAWINRDQSNSNDSFVLYLNFVFGLCFVCCRSAQGTTCFWIEINLVRLSFSMFCWCLCHPARRRLYHRRWVIWFYRSAVDDTPRWFRNSQLKIADRFLLAVWSNCFDNCWAPVVLAITIIRHPLFQQPTVVCYTILRVLRSCRIYRHSAKLR